MYLDRQPFHPSDNNSTSLYLANHLVLGLGKSPRMEIGLPYTREIS
jgi:hypothetical protein